MLRKILTSLLLTSVGLFLASGLATAAPPYEAPPAEPVSVSVSAASVAPGEAFDFSGEGFLPGETIIVTVFFNGPSGLRGTPALAAMAESAVSTTVADENGRFSAGLSLQEAGTYTLTATGQTSGRSVSETITVGTGTGQPAETTTVAAAGGGGSGDSGGLAYTGRGDNAAGGALAYTGTSVAGPMAIGAAALLAGLTLLFFGTRGVIRRKGARSTSV